MHYRFSKFLLPLILLSTTAQARLEGIKISSSDTISSGRGVFDPKATLKGNAVAKALAQMKRARLAQDYKTCTTEAAGARKVAGELSGWVSVQELDCAQLLLAEKKDNSRLLPAIKAAETNTKALTTGVQASRLRNGLSEARLTLLEGDIKTNRARAQETIEKLEANPEWLNDKQRARLWRSAGELSFLQQRIDEAREYFNRSLQVADSDEVRSRLANIDATVAARNKLSDAAIKPTPTPAAASDLEASADENDLVTRVTGALKSGDLVPAVEDAVKLIRQYPGSARAKWATDRVLEVYLQLSDKTDEQFIPLRERVVREMDRADSDRLAEWARVAYNRQFYADALHLAQTALKTMADSARSTKTYALAAEAALHVDQFDTSKDLYQILVSKHSGTAESREALLRIGLIEYRQKDYQTAIASFERLLVLPKLDNLEVTARHWLWRSLQKTKDEARAKTAAQALIDKFPFSYYGLRARAEMTNGVLEWPKDASPKIQSTLWLTKPERAALARAKTLIEGGWYDEAQVELSQLPLPTKPEDKALRSQLLAAAFNYPQAVKLINEAWDKTPELRKEPFLAVSFPHEFTTDITAQAQLRKLDPDLVTSLMKQESSFNIRAQSGSNAFGLMQIIAPTAREIAQDLKLGPILIPEDMWIPNQNIQMGTYYLAKVIKKWNGHVPLGVASYNAGPHRIEKWLNGKPSLKDLVGSRTSDPDNELWFDELPWDETSFYVKAVLRNFLLYQTMAKNKIELGNPLWAQAAGL